MDVSQECKIDIQKAIYLIQCINRINGKSTSFIFINIRKNIWKESTWVHDKTSKWLETELPEPDKEIYKNLQ